VVLTANVEKLMAKQCVHACQIIKEVHLDADQNVSLARNVLKIEPATAKSAQILAQALVDRMPFAMLSTTAPFAVASKAILEIHLPDAILFLVS
jgi:hypothetical protein